MLQNSTVGPPGVMPFTPTQVQRGGLSLLGQAPGTRAATDFVCHSEGAKDVSRWDFAVVLVVAIETELQSTQLTKGVLRQPCITNTT